MSSHDTLTVNKQDMARLFCFAMFTEKELVPWGNTFASHIEATNTVPFGICSEILLQFLMEDDGGIRIKMEAEGIEYQGINRLMDWAFDQAPLSDNEQWAKERNSSLIKMMGSVLTQMFGGEVLETDESSITIKPNEDLPDIFVSAWTPLMDSQWSLASSVTDCDDGTEYYNSSRAIMHRILIRNAIDRIEQADGTIRHVPAASKDRACKNGRPFPQYLVTEADGESKVLSHGELQKLYPKTCEQVETLQVEEGLDYDQDRDVFDAFMLSDDVFLRILRKRDFVS